MRLVRSKGGIVAMTPPIVREFAQMGVRVMTIAPGTFDTPLLAGLPEAARESLGQQVPFPPRLGRSEECAVLVRHMFERALRMRTGQVDVNGGRFNPPAPLGRYKWSGIGVSSASTASTNTYR